MPGPKPTGTGSVDAEAGRMRQLQGTEAVVEADQEKQQPQEEEDTELPEKPFFDFHEDTIDPSSREDIIDLINRFKSAIFPMVNQRYRSG